MSWGSTKVPDPCNEMKVPELYFKLKSQGSMPTVGSAKVLEPSYEQKGSVKTQNILWKQPESWTLHILTRNNRLYLTSGCFLDQSKEPFIENRTHFKTFFFCF